MRSKVTSHVTKLHEMRSKVTSHVTKLHEMRSKVLTLHFTYLITHTHKQSIAFHLVNSTLTLN